MRDGAGNAAGPIYIIKICYHFWYAAAKMEEANYDAYYNYMNRTGRCGGPRRVFRLTILLNMSGKTPQNTSAASTV